MIWLRGGHGGVDVVWDLWVWVPMWGLCVGTCVGEGSEGFVRETFCVAVGCMALLERVI